MVRNHNRPTARAITALCATSRWAISGTPIQNNLEDFLGLFKFLHFAPYDKRSVFDDDILTLWRTKPVEEASKIFRRLLSCVMIRRPNSVLDLPSRNDEILRLSFNVSEMEYYRRIEQPVVEMLDRTTGNDGNLSIPWMTAIQQINKLRLVCNLGTFISPSQSLPDQAGGNTESAELAARLSVGGETCVHCKQPMDSSPFGSDLNDSTTPRIYHSACKRFYCGDCSLLLRFQAPQPCDCVKRPRSCPLQPLKSFLPSPRLTPTGNLSPSLMETGDNNVSSKVWALVSQIRSYPNEKQYVYHMIVTLSRS